MNKYLLDQDKSFLVLNIAVFLLVVILGTYHKLFYLAYFLLAGASLFLWFHRWSVRQIAIDAVFPFLLMYQIYIPVTGSVDVPLAYLFLAFFFALCLLTFKIFDWLGKQKILLLYLFFLYVLCASLLYSQDKSLGMHTILYQTTGLFALVFGFYVREKGMKIDRILQSMLLFGLPIAFCNLIFFLRPDLELSYLKSPIAQVFIQPDQIIHLFDTERNNILDPKKSGTVFVNTNIASVFYQMLFWIALALFFARQQKRYIWLGLLYLLAFFATYSRAGLIALGLTSFAMGLLNLDKVNFWKKIGWLLAPGSIIIMMGFMGGIFAHMLERLRIETVMDDPRFLIWAFAWEAFQESPLIGLGFGGWEAAYPGYAMGVGLNPKFPPHNLLIHLWTWSGLAGVLLLLCIFGYVLWKSVAAYRAKNMLPLALICACLTVIIQGMFENWFLNDYRISSLFFFLTGLFLYADGAKKTPPHPLAPVGEK